jgi:hypothetical protein
MSATIVDWAALGKVIVYSFAAALVLTMLFTTGVRHSGAREHGGAAARSIGVAAFAACGCLVVVGLYVMFTTK